MLADIEHTINSVPEAQSTERLQYARSKVLQTHVAIGQGCHQSSQPTDPPKQRSLFITEVNSSLHTAHHGEVKNSSNTLSFFTAGSVCYTHSLSSGFGVASLVSLQFSCMITKKVISL